MADLKQFLKELDEQEEALLGKINQVIQDVTITIFDSLLDPKEIGGTPKRTGWLRSNYTITINNKFNGLIGSKENVSTSKREASKRIFLGIENLFEKRDIYINNLVPYGPEVNSEQRFREGSIQRGLEKLRVSRKIK